MAKRSAWIKIPDRSTVQEGGKEREGLRDVIDAEG